jgi:enoyl-CoA hydratase/carnithine racemase
VTDHGPIGDIVLQRPAEGVALLVLNRPRVLNAITDTMVDELVTTLEQVSADPTLAALVVTGAGRGFCSGWDLRSMAGTVPRSRSAAEADLLRTHRVPHLLYTLPQPTIAAVNGPAAGAGWGLAAACDIRIAAPTATFAATFVRMGLGPDCGLSWHLPRLAGPDAGLEMLLTGRTVHAEEALARQLVTSVAVNPVDVAIDLARAIAAAPVHTTRSIKFTIRASHAADWDTALREVEVDTQADLFAHPEFLTNASGWLQRHTSD